jgi:nucleoside triphosphate diphosphatase
MDVENDINRLLEIMKALRTPNTGCPWDLEQNFETIAPYTIEEAFEVLDAIERGDMLDLKEELGDLLLQVVFHSRLAEEAAHFSFRDVVDAICNKLIRRHPHVFGNVNDLTPDEVKALWNKIKTEEKAEKLQARLNAGITIEAERYSLLDGVPEVLPSLTRAGKLQAKASQVGFDWDNSALVLEKIQEEVSEIEDAMRVGDKDSIAEEIGDLLFAVVNLARHLAIDPEQSLRNANKKFMRRFSFIEQELQKIGKAPQNSTLEEMDRLWNKARIADKQMKNSV